MKAGERRKIEILNAAVNLWSNQTDCPTTRQVAEKACCTHTTVLYHFPKNTLRNAAANWAVVNGVSSVIVKLILENHPVVINMSEVNRKKHLNAIG